ncbi:monofunctional biosynthetic peptidoglycan transglycosylase [Pikeienuella sp. HZG-20]|uniref:monofunctional biosynthetic peptidoglycan transglycosylase n=1 Tax=Paludibacillus litoralis TaxID=3133267 RepID=UPI0030EB371B
MRRWARKARRRAFRLVLALTLFAVCWVVAYRWVNPPITYLIAAEWIRLGDVSRDWRDLDEISPDLARAVMGGEDARFCAHYGFDVEAIRKALSEKKRRRGASTITQQVAKNAFLWPDSNWVRKGLEAGFTVLIEMSWPKARIMEVYLNIAEMGPGVFGAEAAARHWFGKSAADLSLREAARIAAILPNPRERSAARPSGYVQRRAGAIARGADTLRAEGRAACVSRGG